MTVEIPLRGRNGELRGTVLVDDDDAYLAEHRWCLTGKGYAHRRAGGRFVYLHRELMGLHPGAPDEVDHINGDRLDCRRANLRVVSRAQNAQNKPSFGGSSKYRGVTFDAWSQRWKAQAQLNGRHIHIGRFDTEDEAAEAARAYRAVHMPHANEERAVA